MAVTAIAAALALLRVRRQRDRLSATLQHLSASTQTAGISLWEWELGSNRVSLAPGSVLSAELGGATNIGVQELYGKYVRAEDRERLRAEFQAALRAKPGEKDHLVTRYRRMRPDGVECHVELHAQAVRNAAGRTLRFVGVSRDVTSEANATLMLEAQTNRLRDAERRLGRASRSSHEGHWELCYETKTRWHSASFQGLLGYPAEESIDPLEAAREHTHPDDLADAWRALERHLEADEPLDYTFRMQTADRSYRWFRIRGGVERDAAGRPLRVSGSAQDVHDQKLAEDRLREVQARFERSVAGTEDGLWEIDLSGPRGRFWLSPRLHELLGFKVGELSDDQEVLRELIHPEDRAISDAAVEKQLAEGVPVDVEVRMRTASGAWRWYRLRGRPGFDGSGRVIRTSGSMQDVTEARAAREALVRATQAAQAANHAKSAFLATMSHEIRTPMNGIIGMTALLLDSALGRVQREYAEAIRTSASSLLAIINDILDFSKIEAGKLEIESLEMDLWNQIEEVGSMLALQAAVKGLELIVDIARDVPQTVLGDPQRIRQCLVNLVGNAIKFTSVGEIVIAVRRAGERDGTMQVRFEVRDTGIGIAPEERAELFKPFTQADSSTTRRYGGTGLGLSIVKHLTELMGGEVGLESEVGKGSTFWFTLPLARSEPSGCSQRPALDASPCRVLIVDDNSTSRRVLAGHLAAGPHDVATAASAVEALERLGAAAGEGRPFGAVLIDYQMPEMDGAMLGEHIAGDPRLARSRLILLTSLDRKGDHARFASMGFAAYLTKPVRPRELRECLAHVLEHDAQECSTGTHPVVTRATLIAAGSGGAAYGGRVLVVEDNQVNQKVAQKFLERLGCTVQVAGDGKEAVDIVARERFDLVLMDMQMPVMDGVEATRAIRAAERGGPRTPIVALTANVLAGQFQSCLDAGMDDVLAKPLEAARLSEVLERFVLARSAAVAGAAGTAVAAGAAVSAGAADAADAAVAAVAAVAADAAVAAVAVVAAGAAVGAGATGTAPPREPGPNLASAPLDLARLASLAGEDTAFMRELLATFRASAAAALAEMQRALASLDRERLRRSAHRLRGASENIGAGQLRDLAALVESEAAAAPADQLARVVAAISNGLAELEGFFSIGAKRTGT